MAVGEKKESFMTMMITIVLENRGDWVMMGESRSGGCIKSDVRNFIVGQLADVDKGDRRFTGSRLACFILSSGIQYIRASSIAPKDSGDKERLKTDRANTSSTTIHPATWGHIGPQEPHLASPPSLAVHLYKMIGSLPSDRLMKEDEAPNHWAQSHCADGFQTNAGGPCCSGVRVGSN